MMRFSFPGSVIESFSYMPLLLPPYVGGLKNSLDCAQYEDV